MLRRILEIIQSGEASSVGEIAGILGAPESALEGPIARLLESGHLRLEKADGSVKSGKCLMCSSREFCNPENTGQAYILTDKGKTYVEDG
jgi:predicted transcriptional regulator